MFPRLPRLLFHHRRSAASVFLGLVLVWGTTGTAQAPQGESSRSEDGAGRLRAMTRLAQSFRVERKAGETRLPAKLRADPIHRWSDPARHLSDGTLWAWTAGERPVAVLAIEPYEDPRFGPFWALEFTSLSEGAVAGEGGKGTARIANDAGQIGGDGIIPWNSDEPGLVLKPFPEAPVPTSTEAGRLRQMKDLAKRVTAHEFYGTPLQRFDLRQFPRPLYRFAEPVAGVVDGAIFVFAYGTNPEVLLVLEARREGTAAPKWMFGLARLTTAGPVAEIDHREVWNQRQGRSLTPFAPYYTLRLARKKAED